MRNDWNTSTVDGAAGFEDAHGPEYDWDRDLPTLREVELEEAEDRAWARGQR